MAVLPELLDEGTVNTRDGRRLHWSQWGVADGEPVLLFHGNPGSRLFRPDRDTLVENGVLLVTVDRPGIGGSDPRPGRRMADWADDVEDLADALGLERFAVVGFSMGGPHALATGALIPQRVSSIAVHAPPGPWSERGFADLVPAQVRQMRDAFAEDPDAAADTFRAQFTKQREMMLSDIDRALEQAIRSGFGDPDEHVLDDPTMSNMLADDGLEAMSQGVEGLFEERMAGYVLDWGFETSDVAVPVTISHGSDDRWIPVEVARELASRLPEADLFERDGCGHFPTWSTQDHLIGTVT